MTLLLNLRKGSTEEELRQFFDTLHEQPLAPSPTRQALWKSRRQLAPQVFVALNQGVVEQFRRDFTPKLYWGFRLLAVDGTTLRLPSSRKIEQAFGAATDGPPLARVSLLYDIAQDLVIDTQMAALCVSERELAIEHLAQMGPGDLAIYDRGYPAFWLMALHRAQGSDWCMRLSRGSFAAAEPFWNSAEHSTVITLTPSAEQRRHCRDQAVSAEPLRIRLVRVRLKGGETEVLATSVLDTERLPNRAFGALYHKRWNVEIYQSWCLRKVIIRTGVGTRRHPHGCVAPTDGGPHGGRAAARSRHRQPIGANGFFRPARLCVPEPTRDGSS